jgi:hypothetical protein
VHTSVRALQQGEAEILRIGEQMRAAGVIEAADVERISGQLRAERQLRGYDQTVS